MRVTQVAKDFAMRKYMTFISSLSSSVLLQNMVDIARNVDPQKPIE